MRSHQARLCVKGYQQLHGVDYFDTYQVLTFNTQSRTQGSINQALQEWKDLSILVRLG
jgi:hypothetical protein